MSSYLVRNWKLIFAIIFSTLIFHISISSLPIFLKVLIDNATNLSSTLVRYNIIGFFTAILFLLTFEYVNKVLLYVFHKKVTTALKTDVFSSILDMEYHSFISEDTNYYISLITKDCETLYNKYYKAYIDLIKSFIAYIVYFSVIFYLNYIMGIVIIVASLLSLLIPRVVGDKLSNKTNDESSENSVFLGKLKDYLYGFILVDKISKNNIKDRFIESYTNLEDKRLILGKYTAFTQIFGGASLYFIQIVAFMTGVILIYLNMLQISNFIAIYALVDLVALPAKSIIYIILYIKSVSKVKDKVHNVIKQSLKNKDDKIDNYYNNIELIDVSYSIDNFTISNFSFSFKKGLKYSIIGKSGSGKSTLLKLILGMINNYTGRILIDGKPINKFDLGRIFAYINQDVIIYNEDFYNNITVFNSYSIPNIENEVKKLDAQKLIKSNMGEHGSKLSGGEKNKISILRALNKGCDTLICDEMFANVDKYNTKIISDYLYSKDLTIIEVTHDITIENLNKYDKVLFVKDGRLVYVKDGVQVTNKDILQYL